jgi:hypothetical protein
VNTAPVRLSRITNPKMGRALLLSFTAGLELGVVHEELGVADAVDLLHSGTRG